MGKRLIYITGLLLLCILIYGCKKGNDKPAKDEISIAPTGTELSAAPTATKAPAVTISPTTTIPQPETISNTMTKENFPIIDGSTATIPISEAVYSFATGATEEEAAAAIVHTKTTNAYYRLMNGEADLLIVYEPSEEVKKEIQKNNNIEMKPIGKDALVFMANASNPVQSLTNDQIIEIYSGKISNWSEVGGGNSKILAFQRPDDSGSQTLMQKLVMKDTPMMKVPNEMTFETMEGILKAMADYDDEGNTLGYSVFYYAKNMYQRPELKFMKVNGIEPSLQTIYDGTYPYINEFYAVIRKDTPVSSNAHRIFDWLSGGEGQSLIKSLGYVPENMGIGSDTEGSKPFTGANIPDHYCYVTTSYTSGEGYAIGTVTIYNQNWHKVKVFENAYLSGDAGLKPETALLPIKQYSFKTDKSFTAGAGIYSMVEDRFVLPPIYKDIYCINEEKGFYQVKGDHGYRVIDLNGNELTSEYFVGEGYGLQRMGDNYWIYTYDTKSNKEITYIYDLNLKYIRRIVRDYSNQKLYNTDGSLLISRDIYLKKFKLKNIPSAEFSVPWYYNGEAIFCIIYNGTQIVMDRNLNVIANTNTNGPYTEEYETFNNVYKDNFYNSNHDLIKSIVCDRNGKAVVDQNGDYYSDVIEEGFTRYEENSNFDEILYSIRNSKLSILRYSNGDQFEIDLGDWNHADVNYMYYDIVIVSNSDVSKTRIYKRNQLLYEVDGLYNLNMADEDNFKDKLLLYGYSFNVLNGDTRYLVLNSNGDILYKSAAFESIINIDDTYIQIERGNYFGVIDYNGNFIVKEIRDELKND